MNDRLGIKTPACNKPVSVSFVKKRLALPFFMIEAFAHNQFFAVWVVFVKTFPGFYTQVSGLDHIGE